MTRSHSDSLAWVRDRQATIPTDYFQARAQFREAAAACNATLESRPIAASGPNHEQLTIDIAVIGDPNCRGMVIVSSGLHGVEGFVGSAVQTQVLKRYFARPHRSDQAVVLIHALNPYGFAHLRRVNEENIDLNRNFLSDFGGNVATGSQYRLVDALLNPRRAPSVAGDAWFFLDTIRMIARHGMATMRQIVAEGQYQFPKGLFFGGRSPAESTTLMMRELTRWTADAERIIHLDLHSGLGPAGTITLLLDGQYPQELLQKLRLDNPGVRVERHDESGGAYRATGTLGQWCQRQLKTEFYTFLCAEFGTYGGLSVLRALRAENQAHQWSSPGSRAWRRAKRRLLDCFCPASSRWRERALAAGISLIERTIEGSVATNSSRKPSHEAERQRDLCIH